jgi:hypothetical protein
MSPFAAATRTPGTNGRYELVAAAGNIVVSASIHDQCPQYMPYLTAAIDYARSHS